MNKNILYLLITVIIVLFLLYNKESFSYCFDNDDYKYRIEEQTPCNIHEIDMQELEPYNKNNIGNKICMNDNYQFIKKQNCDSTEFEVYKKEHFNEDISNNYDNNTDIYHEPNNYINKLEQVQYKLHPLVHLD
jgi:hypothetical protein